MYETLGYKNKLEKEHNLKVFTDNIDNKIINYHYLNRYISFINSRNNINENKENNYFESHHVVPKCLNINYNETVNLSIREHAIAHYILCYCFTDKKIKSQMINAFLLKENFNIGRKIIKIKFGERTKKIRKKLASEGLFGDCNPNFGRRSKYMNKDGKNKMVEISEVNEYLSKGWKIGKIDLNSNSNRIHVNNGIISKMVKPEELNYYLSNGFIRGRLTNYITDEYRLKQNLNKRRDEKGRFIGRRGIN